VLLAGLFAGCDGARNVFSVARETTPPTFSTSGNDWLLGIEVNVFPAGMAPEQIGQTQGETIWKISPPKRIWADDVPVITYGEVPAGWSQSIPLTGRPPELIEGRVYEARSILGDGPRGSSFFSIRNGKTVNVTGQLRFSNQ
jgi:hypothetical protein